MAFKERTGMNNPQPEVSLHRLVEELCDKIPLGIYVYHLENPDDDRTLRLIFANRYAEEFVGLSSDQIIGRTIDDNFPGLRKKEIPQEFAEVVRTQNSVDLGEIQYGDSRVAEGWFSVSAFPLQENCLAVSFKNISSRKQTETFLAEKEEQFRTLFDQSPIAMQIMATDGLMLEVNKAWENLWQAKAEDAVGKYNIINDPQSQALGFAEKFKLASLGESVDVVNFSYDPALSGYPGRSRWLSSRIYPILDAQGNVLNVIITHEDTSSRKEAELALLAQKETLEETVRIRTAKLLATNECLQSEIKIRLQAEKEKEALISQLTGALEQVKLLSGCLPICSSCKKIRDEHGSWNPIETYIRERSEADFTHGICPDCAEKLYPGLYKNNK